MSSQYTDVRRRLAEQRDTEQQEQPGAQQQRSTRPPPHVMEKLQRLRAEIAKRQAARGEATPAAPGPAIEQPGDDPTPEEIACRDALKAANRARVAELAAELGIDVSAVDGSDE